MIPIAQLSAGIRHIFLSLCKRNGFPDPTDHHVADFVATVSRDSKITIADPATPEGTKVIVERIDRLFPIFAARMHQPNAPTVVTDAMRRIARALVEQRPLTDEELYLCESMTPCPT